MTQVAAGRGEIRSETSPVVAVARDGWAIVAWNGRRHTFVSLRAPGASRFGPVRAVGRGGEASLSVAIDGRGEAVLAWVGFPGHGVQAVRVGPRRAGAVVRLSPLGAPVGEPKVELTARGRAAVVWSGSSRPSSLYVNFAAAGHPFGPPRLVGEAELGEFGEIEAAYWAGFDATGKLHITWQEDDGSVHGSVWSSGDPHPSTQTLLSVEPGGVQSAPRVSNIATLSSGAQLAVLESSDPEGQIWLSRAEPGGVFGPPLGPPVPGDRAAIASDGWVLLGSLAICRPSGVCAAPAPAPRHEELRAFAVGEHGQRLTVWEGVRRGRLRDRLSVRISAPTGGLGAQTLLSAECEGLSAAASGNGEALVAFITIHGAMEVAAGPGH